MRRILEILLKNNKFPNSSLFVGRKNWGIEREINFVIKYLLCSSNNKPCNSCIDCRKVDKRVHPDFLEIKVEDSAKNIKISQIREIVNFLSYTSSSKNKVIYIKDADLMTIEAENSLLKILEEPGENNYFILSLPNKYRLPPTIISRCVTFNFKPEGLDYIRANIDFEVDEKIFNELNLTNFKGLSFFEINEKLFYYFREYDIENLIKIFIFANLGNHKFIEILLELLDNLKANISKESIIGKLSFFIKKMEMEN